MENLFVFVQAVEQLIRCLQNGGEGSESSGEIDVIIQSPLPVKLFRKGDTNSDFIKV